MRRIFFLTFLLLFFVSENSYALNNRNLTIFAEPNLALALTKIVRIYSQKSHTIVSVNFNSAADLIADIDSGEPADVFISAHSSWIESLRQKGLVDVYNIGYIARDKLVLVTSKTNSALSSNFTIEGALRALNQNKATLILDNEGSSSGFFAKNLITNLGLSDLKIFSKIVEDKTALLTNIQSNDQNYSLLLASQINNQPNLQLLSQTRDGNIFYQALVIAGDNMEVAREFLKFLKSETAKSILKENGFLTD
ncbi:MAG: molybdate ABC transporter substrate-binding protein [Proteobacteria bacterium]|nr:molybdate ABC transporter substrate-binding protein [Pseudomonadota bacterium]